MISNNKIYILVVMMFISATFTISAQRGLKRVYFPQGFEACASADYNQFELTIEWTPPMPAANNVYTVELSDADGNFPNPNFTPITLTKQNSSARFTYVLSFPKNISGNGYRVKVTSSNPYSEIISDPFSAHYITIKNHLSINDKEPNITLCPGETKEISVNDKSAAAYKWYLNGNLIPNAKGPSYTVSKAGVYQAEVDYGSGYCTSSADTKSNKVTVTLQGSTDLKINGGATSAYICQGQSYTLTANKNDKNLEYNWYREGISTPVLSGKGEFTYTTHTGAAAAGKYYLKIGDNNSSCQEKSNIVEVKIRQEFTVDIDVLGGSKVIIPGSSKTLVANVTNAENPTYQWYNGGTKIEGAVAREYTTRTFGEYNVEVIDVGDCRVSKKARESIKLDFPDEFRGKLVNKSYYKDCSTNRVVLGVVDLKAIVGGKEEVIPLSAYGDLKYEWKKDGKIISEKDSEIVLDKPSDNGEYTVVINQASVKSPPTNSFIVKLADATGDISLKASYTPADGGGVVHLCSDFGKERLTVEGVTDPIAIYTWYLDDVKIPSASGKTYEAEEFGRYRVEIAQGKVSCPIVTNSLLLKEIQINANFRNISKESPSYDILFLPYNETELIADISGVDVENSTITWYQNGGSIQNSNKTTWKVENTGDYRYAVKPKGSCPEVTSATVHVRKPSGYRVKIDYSEGSEACNDIKDIKLTLKSLEAEIEVGTVTKSYVTIEDKFYEYYNFEWYKKDKSSGAFAKIGTATSTLEIPAEESGLSEYYLVVESPQEGKLSGQSNTIKAGTERISTVIKVKEGGNAYSTKENRSLICPGEFIVLEADVTTDTPLSDLKYQWYRGVDPVPGAESPTLSVSDEGTYRVDVSGRKCRDVTSKQYTVRYFSKEEVIFHKKNSDKALDLSKVISFNSGEPVHLIVEGAKISSALNTNGFADGIKKISEQEIEINDSGSYNIEVGIATCKVIVNIRAEAIPLPSEVPTVVTPNGANNRYWNLPDKYMDKENVKVSIYTQDGVEVFSTNNYRNDSWPTDIEKESTGRALIYLYIIEVDGAVKERGTITLFQ